MTVNFVKNPICKRIFLYVNKQLEMKIKLILLSRVQEWKKDEDIGILCTDEVYFNMEDIEKFDEKINDLHKSILQDINIENQPTPECFISYCWSNSRKARNKGDDFSDSSIGGIDPRDLKLKIEETGIKCWLDVEQVGKIGLYQDIAKGLKKSKVFVCCISDEYVVSKNCKMEFRFAVLNLKLPTIMVAIGTGYKWRKSEIEMLSQSFPIFFMKNLDEDVQMIKNLIKSYCKTELNKETDKKDAKNEDNDDFKKDGFSELLELTQRKFLKFLRASTSSLKDKKLLPHLLILDLLINDENGKIEGYYFFFLCEYEEGWHIPENYEKIYWKIKWNCQEVKNSIGNWSGYLSKLLMILKETNLPLSILQTSQGINIIDKIIKFTSTSSNDDESKNNFIQSYNLMLKFVENLASSSQQNRKYFQYLTNRNFSGKILWLCEYHDKLKSKQSENNFNKEVKAKIEYNNKKYYEQKWRITKQAQSQISDLKKEKKYSKITDVVETKMLNEDRRRSRACILS